MPRNPLQRGPTTSHYHNTLGVDETTPGGAALMVDNTNDPPAEVTTLVAKGAALSGDEATLSDPVFSTVVVQPDADVSGDLFKVQPDGGTLAVQIVGSGVNGQIDSFSMLSDNNMAIQAPNLALGNTGDFVSAEGTWEFFDAASFFGVVKMIGLPTVDPEVADQLWNDGGVLKVSAG